MILRTPVLRSALTFQEKAMKCVICKHGETKKGRISVILGQDGMMLIFKEVARQVSSNYREEYLGAEKLVGTKTWVSGLHS